MFLSNRESSLKLQHPWFLWHSDVEAALWKVDALNHLVLQVLTTKLLGYQKPK